jgi:hypothetical protein
MKKSLYLISNISQIDWSFTSSTLTLKEIYQDLHGDERGRFRA